MCGLLVLQRHLSEATHTVESGRERESHIGECCLRKEVPTVDGDSKHQSSEGNPRAAGVRRMNRSSDGPRARKKQSRRRIYLSQKKRWTRQKRKKLVSTSSMYEGPVLTPSRLGFLMETGNIIPMSAFSPVAADGTHSSEQKGVATACHHSGDERSEQYDAQDAIARRNRSPTNQA